MTKSEAKEWLSSLTPKLGIESVRAIEIAIECIEYTEKHIEEAKQTQSEVCRDFEAEWQRQMEHNHILSKENEELRQALVKIALRL